MRTFPRSPRKLRIWKQLIRREDRSPSKMSRICNCHFNNEGEGSTVPSIFSWTKKAIVARSPKKKRRRRFAAIPNQNTENMAIINTRCEKSHALTIDAKNVSPVGSVVRQLNFNSNENNTISDLNAENNTAPELNEMSMSALFLRDSKCKQDAGTSPFPEKTPERVLILEAENKELKNEIKRLKEQIANTSSTFCVEKADEGVDVLAVENSELRKEIKKLKEHILKTSSIVHEAENTLLHKEREVLKEKLAGSEEVFLFRKISDKDALISHFTGLPDRESFMALLKLFDDTEIQYCQGWKVKKLDKENQLFLTLLKLRRGLSNMDFSVRFKVGKTTVANVFLSWILALHHVLIQNLISSVPPSKKNQLHLPESFKDYPNTRIILDCTEVPTANPSLLNHQSKMYSNYKHRIASKDLVGIAPNGVVIFVSKLFAGNTSDRNTVVERGVLNCLAPGDTVMADKGFNINDLMPDGVTLNIPPFKDSPQFTVEQINETMSIAQSRIHFERAIARIKNFKILNYIPHLSFRMLPRFSRFARI